MILTTPFKDIEGNISAMNFVWAISVITIITVWSFISIKTNTIQHMVIGDALWIIVLFSGKFLQNFSERVSVITPTSPNGLFLNIEGNFCIIRTIWIIVVLSIVFVWAYLSCTSLELQHFTTGDAGWFLGLFGCKVGNTYVERLSPITV